MTCARNNSRNAEVRCNYISGVSLAVCLSVCVCGCVRGCGWVCAYACVCVRGEVAARNIGNHGVCVGGWLKPPHL